MPNKKDAMIDVMSEYLTKSDIYASRAIAKISALVIKYRHNAGMTQEEFANMMNATPDEISKWESANYNFTFEEIAEICERLGCAFDIEIGVNESN